MPSSRRIDRAKEEKKGLALPWDLGKWVEPVQLLHLAEEEISRLDWANPTLQEHLKRHPEYRPRLLLSLLTWAYATSVFESQQVALACDRESFLRGLCEGSPPSERVIARFRRENRGLLKWSLTRLFKRVLRAKFDLPDTYWPAGLNRYLGDMAAQRLDLARQMDRDSSGF